jgi:hypothetical protein
MTFRDRKRLIVALLVIPLIVVLPSLWLHFGEPHFLSRYMDQLLIFFALPYAAALWLHLTRPRRPHS